MQAAHCKAASTHCIAYVKTLDGTSNIEVAHVAGPQKCSSIVWIQYYTRCSKGFHVPDCLAEGRAYLLLLRDPSLSTETHYNVKEFIDYQIRTTGTRKWHQRHEHRSSQTSNISRPAVSTPNIAITLSTSLRLRISHWHRRQLQCFLFTFTF